MAQDKPEKDDRGRSSVPIYDANGEPYTGAIPKLMSATFMRSVYRRGKSFVGKYDDQGVAGDDVREVVIRAQVPWYVKIHVYGSKFQVTPTPREYLVYAPKEKSDAAKIAFKLWRRWEKPKRDRVEGMLIGVDMEDDYPKVDDAIWAIDIEDSDFDRHWKDVKRTGKFKAAGNPDDPFAFTCLDPDVQLFKVEDVQRLMTFKI